MISTGEIQAAANTITQEPIRIFLRKTIICYLFSIGDNYIQWKFNQIRFQGIPIVIVDRSEPEKIENEIDQPE